MLKNYLGISMLVLKQEDMLATKLAALLTRKRFAARDVFDTWFFLKNNWPINGKILAEKAGMSLSEGLMPHHFLVSLILRQAQDKLASVS